MTLDSFDGRPDGAEVVERRAPALARCLKGGLVAGVAWLASLWLLCSCGSKVEPASGGAENPGLATNGSIQVTARLVEIPEGAIFKRDLYDYTTVLKYRVLKVQRGEVTAETIYVGHYNPWKPRREAPDRRVPHIGGDLRRFQAGQEHHLALEAPLEDFFMGGIVNKYFGQSTEPIYWAVWTDLARP